MKRELQDKWIAATPIICTIVYFIQAFILDKYTNVSKPYLLSLIVFIFVPLSYYIVGLKKFKFIYPMFIVLFYLGLCAFLDGAFGISLWHPLWVLILTIPIYYIFTSKTTVKTTYTNFKDEVKSKFNKERKYDPNDCDFDSSDN